MSKHATPLLILTLLAAFSLCVPLPSEAANRTITVPDDYPTIAEAIQNALDKDTIFVKKGTYEGPINQTLIISKTIALVGEDAETTMISLHPEWVTIDVYGTLLSDYASPLKINAPDVNISALSIRSDGGAISVKGDRAQITENTFFTSIELQGTQENFSRNTLKNAYVATWGNNGSVSENNVINGKIFANGGDYNEIFDNNVTGTLGIGGGSYYPYVHNNTVQDSEGAYIACVGALFANNTVSNCTVGISHVWGYDNTACGNAIIKSRGPALVVSGVYNFTFFENFVANNSIGIQIAKGSLGFTLYRNDFVNNDLQTEILNENLASWQMDNGEEGNYWSDYTGTDFNMDGIGDSPYTVKQGISDRFPLMAPFGFADLIPPPPSESLVTIPVLIIIVVAIVVAGAGFLLIRKLVRGKTQ
jgi:Periplasmic copper-binding protein (NosD)